jgi:PHS family inorganic phosphate transporter-like MFS transporter
VCCGKPEEKRSIFFRLFLGIGLGGDYPLSATITSEFSSARHRGAMVSAVFSMQGLGILAVSIVTLIFLSIFKPLIQADPDNLDYVWRLIIGFGCIPAVVAIYFRMTISETPRYTIEINDDVDKAVKDVECVLNQKYVRNEKKSETTKKATFREFITYFSKWKRFKVLFATSISWFCLDVGFYGTS